MIKLGLQFIEKANHIHDYRYNYDLVEYVNSKIKVKIQCINHGIFEQTPNMHIKGQGCPRCAKNYKYSVAEFITKAIKIHSDCYDYQLVNYINSNTKVKIICHSHGIFEQTPNGHLNQEQGCPQCNGTPKRTTEIFNKDASIVHNNFYDYSEVEYVNCETKVKIICPKHGEFLQRPASHLAGRGCSLCGYDNVSWSKEDIIKEMERIHDGRYNYSLVIYKGINEKIKIICPIHDIFEQRPDAHLEGNGCPKCNCSFKHLNWVPVDDVTPAMLYYVKIYNDEETFYKVGLRKTNTNVNNRFTEIKSKGYKVDIINIKLMTLGLAYKHEQFILEKYKHIAYIPQIGFDGMTECLNNTPIELLEYINAI